MFNFDRIFKRKTNGAFDECVASMLLESIAPDSLLIMSYLYKAGEINIASIGDKIPEFNSELLVFYVHLVDPIAFATFGSEKKVEFMDRLLPAIIRKNYEGLKKGNRKFIFFKEFDDETIVGVQNLFQERFWSTYEKRWSSYYSCHITGKREMEGDLFWEFGKILSSLLLNDFRDPGLIFRVLEVTGSNYTKLVGFFEAAEFRR